MERSQFTIWLDRTNKDLKFEHQKKFGGNYNEFMGLS